jgi:hypothetical protein
MQDIIEAHAGDQGNPNVLALTALQQGMAAKAPSPTRISGRPGCQHRILTTKYSAQVNRLQCFLPNFWLTSGDKVGTKIKGKVQGRELHGTLTDRATHCQRMPKLVETCLPVDRMGSRNQPLYLTFWPRRRSKVSSINSTSALPGGKQQVLISSASSSLLSTQRDRSDRPIRTGRWFYSPPDRAR